MSVGNHRDVLFCFGVSHEIHATEVSVYPRRAQLVTQENEPLSPGIRVGSR